MIREYGPNEASDIPNLPAILLAYLRDGPELYIDNARIEMRVLEIDGILLPLVFADSDTRNTYVCSPHSHHIRYTCEEIIKRNSHFPEWVFKSMFAMWALLIRKKSLDRVLYVNNWLFSTNPDVRLSVDKIKAVTRFLRKRYPGRAIIFRSINPNLNTRLAEALHHSGYQLIPARTVLLLHPLPPDPAAWKSNTRRDISLLKNGRLRIVGLHELQSSDAPRLEKLYRDLYLNRHSQLNQQLNRRFFELAITGDYFEGIFLKDGERIVGMILFHEDGGVLLAQLIGYDLEYGRKEGLYRQIIAALMLEAQSRDLILNLSGGADNFKAHRGAVATLEYEAVMTAGLPFHQRVVWKLVEAQGKSWSRRLRSHVEFGKVLSRGADE